jgi:phosphate/sulfate permease
VGRLSDEGNRAAVLRTGTVYTAASWFVRPIVTGGFGAFLTDLFYRVAKNTMSVPQVSMIYDDARKNHVMRTVVFFEMALSLGKVAAAVLAVAAFTYLKSPWTAVFIMAGLFASLFALQNEPKDTANSSENQVGADVLKGAGFHH